MKFPAKSEFKKIEILTGVLLALLVGTAMLHLNFRLGKGAVRASYSWLFDLSRPLRPELTQSELFIIYMDEKSYIDLGQPFNLPWDRKLHASLLDHLTRDGARAVLFDILFTDPGPSPEADDALARALKRNGRTILAADYSPARQSAGQEVALSWTLTPPLPLFAEAAAAWGLAQLTPDEDFIIREHYHGPRDQEYPGMAWAAANVLGLETARNPENRFLERWINYYGPPATIPHISYSHAREMPAGFFKDKIVMIGVRPIAGTYLQRRDELRSPYFVWNESFLFAPAVEVQATVLLNLVRHDWLRRTSPASEFALLALVALLSGVMFSALRPLPGLAAAGAAIFVITLSSVLLFVYGRVWFPWIVIALGQIPITLLWCALFKSVEWYFQKRNFELEGKHARLRIREQAELLDKAHDAIIVGNLNDEIIFWNRGAERLYGWPAAESIGKNINALLHKNPISLLAEAKGSVVRQGEWAGELVQVTRDNKDVTVDSRWSLVRDERGEPTSILVINTDVTQKVLLEGQLLRTQRMESIGTLAGGIAHDLNNLLTPIMMCTQLLELKNSDPDSENLLKSILNSSCRARDLVKQVLTFARGHEGEHSVLQLNHLVKEMEKLMRETFPKSIKVSSQISTDISPVSGDATQLHQILLNLCVNARDAMPEGGEILIATEDCTLTEVEARLLWNGKAGDFVRLYVSDTGTGIPAEIIEKIFEPFFTTKEVGKGTGLGLSTVLSIVKSHHGFLDIKSVVGQGTTFSVYLPATRLAVSAGAAAQAELPRASGELILVVDDELAIREATSQLLTHHGYQVVTAPSGIDAIDLLTQRRDMVALALVDIAMPGLDGVTTIRSLRNVKPGLPCVAMSGLIASETNRDRLAKMEVTCLAKPFTTDRLLRILAKELAAHTEPAPDPETWESPAVAPVSCA